MKQVHSKVQIVVQQISDNLQLGDSHLNIVRKNVEVEMSTNWKFWRSEREMQNIDQRITSL